MSNKGLIKVGLLLIVVPLVVVAMTTMARMISTHRIIASGQKLDPAALAESVNVSLVSTWIAIPIVAAGVLCVLFGLVGMIPTKDDRPKS